MSLKSVSKFPHKVKETKHLWIILSDGVRLAARLWLPADAAKNPVPTLLEYIPYRKSDGTVARDAVTAPYLAGHGYGVLRVDLRGSGDSDGHLADEYLKLEQDDALEVIAWAAQQKWCSGQVGMFGNSWGGFNALQVAVRQPPALKAIITCCSTDDRYADDIHYKGGTLLNENLGWAATMLAYQSRPPDPEAVGPGWKKIWFERLKKQPFLAVPWLQHPHRDEYWKHGSVCENYGQITAATLVVGGWNDAYANAIPRLMSGLRSPRKAIIGPWAHGYPHLASPGPQIGFCQEMLRWFDAYLKGKDSGIATEPDFRFYMMEPTKPGKRPDKIEGRWLGDEQWGAGHTVMQKLHLAAKGISGEKGEAKALTFTSSQACGFDGGEYCVMGDGPEFAGDQARDDSQSLTFDSPVLAQDMALAGAPVLELDLSVDKPVAHIAVRLNDVWPSGEVSRITYQLQNLTQRVSRGSPLEMEAGRRYRVTIKLNDVACIVPKGHKLRVAISTSYFPMMWPAPEPVALTVHCGSSELHLPIRTFHGIEKFVSFAEAEGAKPAAITQTTPAQHRRDFTVDPKSGESRLVILDDEGTQLIKDSKLEVSCCARETYAILPNDPHSAKIETHWTVAQKRGRWSTRAETFTRMTSTKTHWVLWAKIEAFEGKKKVFTKEFNEKIKRQLM